MKIIKRCERITVVDHSESQSEILREQESLQNNGFELVAIHGKEWVYEKPL